MDSSNEKMTFNGLTRAAAAAAVPPPRLSLLGLPKEMRLEICEYLLKPWTVEVVTPDEPTIFGVSEQTFFTTRCFARAVGKQLYPEILRTCQKVHVEAAHLLLGPRRLALYPSLENSTDKSSFRHLNFNHFRSLRHISFLQVELNTTRRMVAEDIAHSKLLANVLQQRSRVQTLTLDIVAYEEAGYLDEDCTELADWHRLFQIWSPLAPSHAFTLRLIKYDYQYRDAADNVSDEDFACILGSWTWKKGQEPLEWALKSEACTYHLYLFTARFH